MAAGFSPETVRRVLLTRIQYYLYYRADEAEGAVEVLAIWHARRGGNPPI